MTERDRWQLWVGFIVISVIVGFAGGLVALASLSRWAMIADFGFMGVVLIVIVAVSWRARRRPDLLVPPTLRGLDSDSRQMVSRAVNTGAPADRPELAPAVVAHARRREVASALFLLIWALVVAARLVALVSGESGGGAIVDLMVIAGSILAGAASMPTFFRARRAVAANSAGVR